MLVSMKAPSAVSEPVLGSIEKMSIAGAAGLLSERYRDFDTESAAMPKVSGVAIVEDDLRVPVDGSSVKTKSCELLGGWMVMT